MKSPSSNYKVHLLIWCIVAVVGVLGARYATGVVATKKVAPVPPPFARNAIIDALAGEISKDSNGLMKLSAVSVRDTQWHADSAVLLVAFDYTLEFSAECWYLDAWLTSGTPIFVASPKKSDSSLTVHAQARETKTFPLKGAFIWVHGGRWAKLPGWVFP